MSIFHKGSKDQTQEGCSAKEEAGGGGGVTRSDLPLINCTSLMLCASGLYDKRQILTPSW